MQAKKYIRRLVDCTLAALLVPVPPQCYGNCMASYDPRSNQNHYNRQNKIASTYREFKTRLTAEQVLKLEELCGATGLSASEVVRRLINVCTPELIQDVVGIIPVKITAEFDNPLNHIEGMCPVCGLFECNCEKEAS